MDTMCWIAISLTLLSFSIKSLAAESFLASLNVCNSDIVKKISEEEAKKSSGEKLPANLGEKLDDFTPWVVKYANYKDELHVIKTKWSTQNKLEITQRKGDASSQEETIDIDWNNLLKGDGSNHLKMHVWAFNQSPAVIGYYLCKTQATQGTETLDQPHIGVAISYYRGPGGGGITSEATDTAETYRKSAATLFSIAEDDLKTLEDD